MGRLLVSLFSFIVLCLLNVPGLARDPIPFQMGEATQAPMISKGTSVRSSVKITIHEAPVQTKAQKEAVWISVYDVKPLPGKEKDGGCAESRKCNRMLIIHATETKKILVKVCRGGICNYETRDTGKLPVESTTLLHYLAGDDWKAGKWKVGDDECSHFKLVNFNDKANAALIKELDIKWDDLPLLVKEGDTEKRKHAHGMKGNDVANIWNKWFVEPEAELRPTANTLVSKCVPGVAGANGLPQWDYYGQGTLRDHLIDPTSPHRLPKVLVDGWSDAQVQSFHNLHHEAMKRQEKQTQSRKTQTVHKSSAVPTTDLSKRIAQLAMAERRVMPSLGKSGDSPKKLHPLNVNGDGMSGIEYARQSAARYLLSINRSMDS